MAQPATNPKIEELRFKLKTDPKSRLFYQLAEELRRAGQFAESEKILRSGLSVYPAYLAAWVSLGRVLRELKDDAGAVDPLNKALQLDPGNVVAARLLADAYLAIGDKVEAIKKYKLVYALLPSDETLQEQIAKLEQDLAAEAAEPEPQAEEAPPEVEEAPPEPRVEVEEVPQFFAPPVEESPFDKTIPPFGEAAEILGEKARAEEETGDAEPMAFAHEESPFEDPAETYTEAALEIEAPPGIHIAAAPLAAEVPAPAVDEIPAIDDMPRVDEVEEPEAPEELLAEVEPTPDPFETEPPPASPRGDAADTSTMADLYARQGLIDDARHIYENILARDPGNHEVRAKLDALTPPASPAAEAPQDVPADFAAEPPAIFPASPPADSPANPPANPKIAKLEQWLSKVAGKEVGRV
jgi:tetratricopeptide (TPR) repeat protein